MPRLVCDFERNRSVNEEKSETCGHGIFGDLYTSTCRGHQRSHDGIRVCRRILWILDHVVWPRHMSDEYDPNLDCIVYTYTYLTRPASFCVARCRRLHCYFMLFNPTQSELHCSIPKTDQMTFGNSWKLRREEHWFLFYDMARYKRSSGTLARYENRLNHVAPLSSNTPVIPPILPAILRLE